MYGPYAKLRNLPTTKRGIGRSGFMGLQGVGLQAWRLVGSPCIGSRPMDAGIEALSFKLHLNPRHHCR